MPRFLHLTLCAALLLPGCAGPAKLEPRSSAFVTAPVEAQPVANDYRIGPLDTLTVSVFSEPDLAVKEQAVTLAGTFSMPLLGDIPAVGRTASDLGKDIASRLNVKYLRDARVSVAVVKAVNYTFTVDGEVAKPGVYEIPGRIGLMQAVALGQGATEFAKISDVVVVRTIDGQRYAARFDLQDIRTAHFPDPEIKQADVVIVGTSASARFFRTLVGALPAAAGLFIAIRNF